LSVMEIGAVPIFVFALAAAAVAVGMALFGKLVGPGRTTPVKQMPYESGMDPVHDARRRFDVWFYLVAIEFLLFDVELLFLYPWAVASGHPQGIDRAVAEGLIASRTLVFGGAMVFIGLLTVGLIYAWRKGAFRWR